MEIEEITIWVFKPLAIGVAMGRVEGPLRWKSGRINRQHDAWKKGVILVVKSVRVDPVGWRIVNVSE